MINEYQSKVVEEHTCILVTFLLGSTGIFGHSSVMLPGSSQAKKPQKAKAAKADYIPCQLEWGLLQYDLYDLSMIWYDLNMFEYVRVLLKMWSKHIETRSLRNTFVECIFFLLVVPVLALATLQSCYLSGKETKQREGCKGGLHTLPASVRGYFMIIHVTYICNHLHVLFLELLTFLFLLRLCVVMIPV